MFRCRVSTDHDADHSVIETCRTSMAKGSYYTPWTESRRSSVSKKVQPMDASLPQKGLFESSLFNCSTPVRPRIKTAKQTYQHIQMKYEDNSTAFISSLTNRGTPTFTKSIRRPKFIKLDEFFHNEDDVGDLDLDGLDDFSDLTAVRKETFDKDQENHDDNFGKDIENLTKLSNSFDSGYFKHILHNVDNLEEEFKEDLYTKLAADKPEPCNNSAADITIQGNINEQSCAERNCYSEGSKLYLVTPMKDCLGSRKFENMDSVKMFEVDEIIVLKESCAEDAAAAQSAEADVVIRYKPGVDAYRGKPDENSQKSDSQYETSSSCTASWGTGKRVCSFDQNCNGVQPNNFKEEHVLIWCKKSDQDQEDEEKSGVHQIENAQAKLSACGEAQSNNFEEEPIVIWFNKSDQEDAENIVVPCTEKGQSKYPDCGVVQPNDLEDDLLVIWCNKSCGNEDQEDAENTEDHDDIKGNSSETSGQWVGFGSRSQPNKFYRKCQDYIPRAGTLPYIILRVLFNETKKENFKGYVSIMEIVELSSAFTFPGLSEYIFGRHTIVNKSSVASALSSKRPLLSFGLILKKECMPACFSITEKGKKVAAALENQHI